MIRITSLIGAIGLAALFAAACDGADTTFLSSLLPLTPAAGAGGAAGAAGSRSGTAGGSAGIGTGDLGGEAGANSSAPVTPSVDALDAGPQPADAGSLASCAVTADCVDQNACTIEACVDGACSFPPAAVGTACGNATVADECTQPDACDGNGVCLANDQPAGTLCADGHCDLTGVCDCAVERITAVPYDQPWQTTAETEIDILDLQPCQLCDSTPDHIVVFTAPAAATYRFTATSFEGDVELTLFEGDCAAAPAELVCGENIDPDNDNLDDQLDWELAEGATVTVVVAEQCEERGNQGTLRIEVAPEEP